MHLKIWRWSVSQIISMSISWTNQSIHYMVFCRQKIPNKDLSWSKSEKVYTRLYLNKLESTMRALSDDLPTGHRAMANPTLQLHFGCGRATPPLSHSHNWPSGRMQNFLFKIGQKKSFFANKDPKNNFDAWVVLQKPVLSFKCNDFLKMANLKAISSSATLTHILMLNESLLFTCYGSLFSRKIGKHLRWCEVYISSYNFHHIQMWVKTVVVVRVSSHEPSQNSLTFPWHFPDHFVVFPDH